MNLLGKLILSEIVLIIIVIIIYMLINRSKSNKLMDVTDTLDKLPDYNIADYFTEEIERTSNELLSRDVNALNNTVNIDYLPLNLRLSFLGVEKENASRHPEKNEMKQLQTDLFNVLSRYNILSALELSENKEGHLNDEYKEIIDRQNKTIEFLKKYANEILIKILNKNEQLIQDSDDEEHTRQLSDLNIEFKEQTEKLMVEINNLENNNIEMNQCLGVLEEENSFLRKQIEYLLKLEDENH